ncbi:MAG: hypothetical protein KGD70_08710 [Candidatus Lokiarchaeota archaeon]|nr:hypothetical protein [Candidatus Lokiarchaeota archaeon]
MTARTGLITLAIVPIAILLLSPGFRIVFTGLEFTLFVYWGISCIINIITAILFKRPPEKQST